MYMNLVSVIQLFPLGTSQVGSLLHCPPPESSSIHPLGGEVPHLPGCPSSNLDCFLSFISICSLLASPLCLSSQSTLTLPLVSIPTALTLGQPYVFHLNYVTLPVLFALPSAPPILWEHHRLKSTGEWSDPLRTSYQNEDCSIWSSHDLFFNLISYYFPTFQWHQLFFNFSNVIYSFLAQDFCTCYLLFFEWSSASSFYNWLLQVSAMVFPL